MSRKPIRMVRVHFSGGGKEEQVHDCFVWRENNTKRVYVTNYDPCDPDKQAPVDGSFGLTLALDQKDDPSMPIWYEDLPSGPT